MSETYSTPTGMDPHIQGMMPTKRCLAMGYNQSLSLPAIHDHFLVTVTVKALES